MDFIKNNKGLVAGFVGIVFMAALGTYILYNVTQEINDDTVYVVLSNKTHTDTLSCNKLHISYNMAHNSFIDNFEKTKLKIEELGLEKQCEFIIGEPVK